MRLTIARNFRMTFLSTYWSGGLWTASTWPSNTGLADTIQWTYPNYLALQTASSDGRTITYGYDNAGTPPTALTYAHAGTTLLSTSRPTPTDLSAASPITKAAPTKAYDITETLGRTSKRRNTTGVPGNGPE